MPLPGIGKLPARQPLDYTNTWLSGAPQFGNYVAATPDSPAAFSASS